jgi:hypothetical protein
MNQQGADNCPVKNEFWLSMERLPQGRRLGPSTTPNPGFYSSQKARNDLRAEFFDESGGS